MYILVDCKDWKVICVDYVPILCNVCVLGSLLSSNWWVINFSAYLCTYVYIVWFKLVLHIRSGHSVKGPIPIPTFYRLVIILVAGGIVPVASCGPLVHSSACTLCVTLMACSPPLDVGHPLLSPHMHVHLVSFSSHSMKEAFSLLTCSDIVSSESCLQP